MATGLSPARGTRRLGFGTYQAANYDELIDCPVEMGTFELGRFEVLGVPHEIAVTGRVPKLDMERLTADLARVCEAQIRLFEPRTKKAPFSRYTFMTMAVGDGYGGLEHRNSTALLCKRDDLPFKGMKDTTEGYRNFLGLASHEYFHSWNVKRIKPAAFVPYDLTQENYTRLLWAFEGFTSYYDDLMLVRAGLLTEKQYLETLAKTLTTVLQRTSRLKQSVADSSFDAWIKYYRQDENAPNSVVSYYQKGSLVGLALDLTLRAETKGRVRSTTSCARCGSGRATPARPTPAWRRPRSSRSRSRSAASRWRVACASGPKARAIRISRRCSLHSASGTRRGPRSTRRTSRCSA